MIFPAALSRQQNNHRPLAYFFVEHALYVLCDRFIDAAASRRRRLFRVRPSVGSGQTMNVRVLRLLTKSNILCVFVSGMNTAGTKRLFTSKRITEGIHSSMYGKVCKLMHWKLILNSNMTFIISTDLGIYFVIQ